MASEPKFIAKGQRRRRVVFNDRRFDKISEGAFVRRKS